MKIGDIAQEIRIIPRISLSVLLGATVICGSCGDGAAPGHGEDAGTDGSGSDGMSHPSYTAARVTSACDDLSSAAVLELGRFTHVTNYLDLPFSFPLFGETATRFVIAEQGQIFLGGPLFVTTVGEPQAPPNVEIPNGWVAPFWDPLLTYLRNDRGDARVLLAGSGASERLVIGYNDFTLRFPSDVPNPDVHLSFQVALLRQSQAIEFRYCRLDPGPNPSQELQDRVLGAATGIGLESADGTSGVSYSFETPLESDGISIRFTPAP
jgi:hypothetical protein